MMMSIDAGLQAVHADNMNGRNVVDFENRYECKDGSYRMLSWMVGGKRVPTASAWVDFGLFQSVVCPDTKRVAAIATDITDHRHQLQVLYRLMIQGNYGVRSLRIPFNVSGKQRHWVAVYGGHDPRACSGWL